MTPPREGLSLFPMGGKPVCLFLILWSLAGPLGGLSAGETAQDEPAAFSALSAGETLRLDTGWVFFWGELVPPREASAREDGRPIQPTNWVSQGYPPFGRATYYRRISAPAGKTFDQLYPRGMGLRFKSTYSSLECFVNGRSIGRTGNPRNPEQPGGQNIQRSSFTADLPPGTRHLDVVIHTANPQYGMGGGMFNAPVLGPASWARQQRNRQMAQDMLVTGVFLFMGIYHIILWFFRREDKAPLFLGLFTLLISLRHLTTSGEKMIYVLFPQFPFSLWMALLVLHLYPLMPLYLSFIHYMFPRQGFPRLYRIAMAFSGIYLIVGLIRLPYNSAAWFYPFFALLTGGVILTLLRAYRAGEQGALLLLTGSALLRAAVLHDILVDQGVIHQAYLLGFGLFFFIFFQGVVLARNFSLSFLQIRRLSREVNRANGELKALDRLKDQFLANTSHELRTPLNGIIGLAEVLRDEALGPLNREQEKNLQLIVISSRRLYNQVNDLLDFSQIKENKISIQPKALQFSSVARVVAALIDNSEGKPDQIAIEVDLPEDLPPVRADEQRLDQILHNLMNNALKFTREGTVTLRAEDRNGQLLVEVADTGIGIPREKQEEIFTPFQQADGSIAREYGGVGLGLSITKSLVELHGGEIGVDSSPGRGSCFWFTLPFAAEEDGSVMTQYLPAQGQSRTLGNTGLGRQERKEAGMPSEGGFHDGAPRDEAEDPLPWSRLRRGERISALAVDDDRTNLRVLSQQLLRSGFEVHSVEGGREALELLNQGLQPDIIISDVMMPGITGFDLTHQIREGKSPGELPIILLTAKNQSEAIVHGFASGANDYLTKPFSRDELVARVHTHTALARLTRSYKRFIPQEFLLTLGKENITDFVQGDQKETSLAILFSDIKGFTRLSEGLSPQDNFNFINSYLGRFGPLIRSRGGFVDKYIGDEIMALFPENPLDPADADFSPSSNSAPPSSAAAPPSPPLATAVHMRRELAAYNRDRQSIGYAPVDFGVGIHQGRVIMGIVGEAERMDTTVISDVVNTASRLERLTRPLEAGLLFTRTVLQGAEPDRRGLLPGMEGFFFPLGHAAFRGKEEALEVWEWLHPDEGPRQEKRVDHIPRFAQAREAFLEGRGDQALPLFEALLKEIPEEPVYRLYRLLCLRQQAEPDRPDWYILDPRLLEGAG